MQKSRQPSEDVVPAEWRHYVARNAAYHRGAQR